MSQSDQQAIAKYFDKKPVLYIGGLGQVLSLQAGILLSQLLFWHGKGIRKDGYIFKTADEIRAELGMSRSNQETAIRQLKAHGIIDYKISQVPARRHFKVNLERLHELLPSLKETSNLHYPNPSNYYVESGETITKITRENTSKSQAVKIDKNNFSLERSKLINNKSVKPP
jgi:biotin operon repressor